MKMAKANSGKYVQCCQINNQGKYSYRVW